MTAKDRIHLADRYLKSAERHLSTGNIERAREAMAGARGMLSAAITDDYAEGVRDGRVAEVRT